MRAHIVIDLGFGDSGKGLLTDTLARHLDAGVVVRYNGGAQAGHNVVTPDGRHHTFSQFGSGTFVPRVKTFLSRHVVIHPQALLVEGDLLEQKGVPDVYSRLRVSEQSLVITPFHQAANRIRELVRGANRHGSCGVGVGEAVEDLSLNPEQSIFAGDLNDPDLLRQKLHVIRDRKREQMMLLCRNEAMGAPLDSEFRIFFDDHILDTWISSVSRIRKLGLVVTDSVLESWLHETRNVIFEGAQGVLLDEDVGFHPYTTWSRCTEVNAEEILQQMAPKSEVHHIGVLRSYAVRHGPGPLPTETDDLTSVVQEHNKSNPWQGPVRYGWFDAVLARYAIEATGQIDSLAVTYMDILPRLQTWKFCTGYHPKTATGDGSDLAGLSEGKLSHLPLMSSFSLDQREKITKFLFTVSPTIATCKADENTVIRQIEMLLERPMGMVSHGVHANDVRMLKRVFQS